MVATDTWVSMGQEEEAAKRIKDYEGYQVSGAASEEIRPDLSSCSL